MMSNQLYIQKNWLFTEKLDAYLLNISQVKQIVPRFQISSYGSSVSHNWCKALTLGTKLATRGIKWEIRGYRFSYLASNPFI